MFRTGNRCSGSTPGVSFHRRSASGTTRAGQAGGFTDAFTHRTIFGVCRRIARTITGQEYAEVRTTAGASCMVRV